MIEVVSAVIVRDGRILLTQRRADKDFPFTWECPGGKVDGNESHHDAVKRELMEELGCEPDAIAPASLWCGEFKNVVSRGERAHIFLLFYAARLPEGAAPCPREGQGVGWFAEEEIHRLALTPGNASALGRISGCMRSDFWRRRY